MRFNKLIGFLTVFHSTDGYHSLPVSLDMPIRVN